MIVLTHPTGNANVRAVLGGLQRADLLSKFATTIAFTAKDQWINALPAGISKELRRRRYDLPKKLIFQHRGREAVRMASLRAGWRAVVGHETGWASVDGVYRSLDRSVAAHLAGWKRELGVRAVYAYEDGAYEAFGAAAELGMLRAYDLPIAYCDTARRLLTEEAERHPEWEPTLVGTRDSESKLERKREEARRADVIFSPSGFVYDSLPAEIRATKHCVVAEFGSPAPRPIENRRLRDGGGPLRVLFAGSLTQRKGLADLMEAVRMLKRSDIELVLLGSPVVPLEFYKKQPVKFTYEGPRPHAQVLELMELCDVFVLPSIVEGRALVQQEAMTCGLPLIVTRNAGGDDLIVEGQTGFLVPIRSPEAIAEKLTWMADHRSQVAGMSNAARDKAALLTWESYGDKVTGQLRKELASK